MLGATTHAPCAARAQQRAPGRVAALRRHHTPAARQLSTACASLKAPRAAAVEAPVAASPSSADLEAKTAASAAADTKLFNWHKAWYPVAALSSLQADRPNALALLDLKLVAWHSSNDDSWHVFEDLCPHRLAPLSEGRLHNGELMCSYHAWRFNEAGACTCIPQIADAAAHRTACSSRRSAVRAFPARVLHGCLWVWPSSSPGAAAEAAASSPAVPPQLDSGDWQFTSVWFQRDVPLSYDTIFENLLDPAHFEISHHNVLGDRNADQTMTVESLGEFSKAGFGARIHKFARDQVSHMLFEPPALVRHEFPGSWHLLLYAIPTGVGTSRLIMNTAGPPGVKPPAPRLPPLIIAYMALVNAIPALQHALQRNAILDGDTYFLHAAERTLYARGDSRSWRAQYFMPSTSDAGVLAWRRWMDEFGAGLPVLPASAADLSPVLPREQVFDRLNQHTKFCPHCRAALRTIHVAVGLLAALAAVAAGSIVASVVAGAAPLASGLHAAAAGVAVAAGLAIAGLLEFRRYFVMVDWVHADR